MQAERYLIFGGTGSLGRVLVASLLQKHKQVTVFSRDEAKHHSFRRDFPKADSIIGDIRDYASVLRALHMTAPTHIINAAAMKQLPLCEDAPYEALLTNTHGAHNLTDAVREHVRTREEPIKVLSISTDKACKPVNVYGMTKALQEKIHLQANNPPFAIHSCVRYGNVLESSGSVIPLFREHISKGEPLSITDPSMTRFLLSLEEAVELIHTALEDTEGGKIFIPKVRSTTIGELADVLIEASKKRVKKVTIGVRPGEKMHELLISEEELPRTEDLGDMYVIHNIASNKSFSDLTDEYSSETSRLGSGELKVFLRSRGVIGRVSAPVRRAKRSRK